MRGEIFRDERLGRHHCVYRFELRYVESLHIMSGEYEVIVMGD